MPHVGGDEPDDTERIDPVAAVCPTYVGMNRLDESEWSMLERMPHVGGDEPSADYLHGSLDEYAPRRWG